MESETKSVNIGNQDYQSRKDARKKLALLSIDENIMVEKHVEMILESVGSPYSIAEGYEYRHELPCEMDLFELAYECRRIVGNWAASGGEHQDRGETDWCDVENMDWMAIELEARAHKLAEALRSVSQLIMPDGERVSAREAEIQKVLSE